MSGSIQSSNYVPGVSGWKLNNLTGDFEINSCTRGSAAKAPERQMVSVEVASYSKYDLPKNAGELLAFMQAELQKVPNDYRHAAEFEEFDTCYGDESFNARLFLSYSRLETEEELADRLAKAKAKVVGTRFTIKNGLIVVSHDGVVRCKIGDLSQPEPEPERLLPFEVVGGKVYISDTAIKDATIDSKLAANWSVKTELLNGKFVAAGIGLGLESQFLVCADRFVIEDGPQPNDSGDALAMAIKGVIRTELKPGGLLHRSR
ncbi:MAG: phage tail tip fiber protein [Pseudomonas fluorescens]